MIDAYIIEDEFLARQELIFLLEGTKVVNIVGEAEDIHQALWDINEKQPDAVFLDIELENGNGLDLAKQFSNLKKRPLVVFVTAYDQYALNAFELDAIDYIVKPIDTTRVIKAVDKILRIINGKSLKENTKRAELLAKERKQTITAKDEDRIILINTKDILCIGTENRQTYIQTKDKKYMTDQLLYKIKEKLGNNFIQVHRGYIVNIKQIEGLEPWFNRTYLVILKNGIKISVSRSYVKAVKQALGL